MRRSLVTALLVLGLAIAGLPADGAEAVRITTGGDPAGAYRVLVFSKTTGFRHGSIPAGITAIQQLGARNGFAVDATEDAGVFTDADLARYAAVVWLDVDGNGILDAAQQEAFQRYIRAGGGFAGVHAAANAEKGWPWYRELVGAWFRVHPAIQRATVNVDDRAHPSTAALPARWERTDEWYAFDANPRPNVHVLMTVDESTYAPGNGGMGRDHPVAWCQSFEGGRSWYTSIGHADADFADPAYLGHLLGGIQSAAGAVPSDCGATLEQNFVKVPIDTDTAKPIRLTPAPDGRIFYLEQAGQVKVYDPATNEVVVAADFVRDRGIYNGFENGTVGIALDPAFEDNGWLYLYYTPAGQVPCPATEAPNARCGEVLLSRFTMVGNTLDLASERVLLRVVQQRDTCCHTTGDLAFDAAGNLYLSTGDDTNPWESSGYTPIDERAGRQSRDAQRTSANTNDLRGKILRIRPEPDGTYSIPEGNLFAPDTPQARPEIYAMGMRNPFTITVDPATQALVVSEYGPDATSSNPLRGPEGRVELNYMTRPGNYGWPYCIAENTPYVDYGFVANVGATTVGVPTPDVSRQAVTFDCANPVNDSPNNTGLRELPPAIPSTLYQSISTSSAPAHAMGQGSAPMTGPFFSYDPAVDLASDVAFPAYYDGVQLYLDWNKGFFYEIHRDDERRIRTINRFLASTTTATLRKPIEAVQAADGSLYVAEWGTEQFFGPNGDSGIYRIEYRPRPRVSQPPTGGGGGGGGGGTPLPPLPSVAVEGRIVAPPNAAGGPFGFLPSEVALTRGSTLQMTNLDTTGHQLDCVARDPATRRPLCATGSVNPQATGRVAGVEKLPAGTYALICSIHPSMQATLRVV